MAHPILYEINTRPWLRELGDKAGRDLELQTVPEKELDRWATLGFTHIWLMGVWQTGPRSRAQAMAHPDLVRHYKEILPDWTEKDVLGSPYSIAAYQVAQGLGGEDGLEHFRARLHERGLKLLLDFVPNHLGLDHPWLRERPGLFVQGRAKARDCFSRKVNQRKLWFAHGKDPYFSGWTDTVQLDYRSAETHQEMRQLLLDIAGKCDGVRCDMAMLVLRDVFERTWAEFPPAGEPASLEFWPETIQAVRQVWPDFIFLAEVYWDLEQRLQELGFDYTYDKRLYDLLLHRDYPAIPRYLNDASPKFISASAHFLENHDEPRIASKLSFQEHASAALLILGLPGMRFLYEGKLEGSLIFTKVQLGRRPREEAQPEIVALYERLLRVLRQSAVGQGTFALLPARPAWPGNRSSEYFVLIQWTKSPTDFDLVVINLAAHRSQCFAPLSIPGLAERHWQLRDRLSPEEYLRDGASLAAEGLFLDVAPHGGQIFHFEPA